MKGKGELQLESWGTVVRLMSKVVRCNFITIVVYQSGQNTSIFHISALASPCRNLRAFKWATGKAQKDWQ